MEDYNQLFRHQDDIDSFAEAIFEATGRTYSNATLRLIFQRLPTRIKELAGLWGLSDEEFRTEVYRLISVSDKRPLFLPED